MKISGWVLGLFSFLTIIVMTGVCSIITFSATRGAVIDLWDSGVQVGSPGEMVDAVFNGVQGEPSATPFNPPADGGVVQLPTIAMPTDVPTEAAQVQPTDAGSIDETALPTMTPTVEVQVEPQTVAEAVDPAEQYKINDPRQIRILLMGIDQRSATDDRGPFRTDTMILLNVDPVRKTAGLISLPRDLWVQIPNFQPARINTANYLGDLNAYPGGGGPALAMETVAANFGVRVDKYILINFDVFERTVDILAPNGIEVCVTEVIDDPDYPDAGYGTIPVHFDPGCEFMDSTRLLQYARTRATEGGDFDRARRQQQVLDSIRAHVLSAGGMTTFLTQVPTLWTELSGSYKTNLTIDEIISLGFLMGEIDRENIRFGVIDRNYVQLGESPDGTQKILIPETTLIADLIQRVFYPQNELDIADIKARADLEGAAIYVYNGTDVTGLANAGREWLTGNGFVVTGTGNDTNFPGGNTVIRDYGGTHTWTARYLAEIMGIPQDRIQPGSDGLIAEGVMVVAGDDMQAIISR